MMKTAITGLSEAEQDATAIRSLSQMKIRSRLERVAAGSIWPKLGWIVPILFCTVTLGLAVSGKGTDLSDLLPILVVWLLFHIQGLNMQVNSRIDAIYQLMKQDREANTKIEEAEQDAALRTQE